MTFTDRGQGFDVSIGDLPFRLAIDKEQPYERATAQFRKDQIDQSATVGDQSLTGWWTRGQLSFHKGAGVTYYEVLQGETVLERYRDSDSIEVSTPGTATLIPALSDLSLNALDAVPAPLSAGGGVHVLTDTGIKYTAGGTSSAIATSDSGVPTSLTSNGKSYFVANGDKVEKQFDDTAIKTNHVTNPSFETNTTGWTGTGTNLAQTNFVTNPSFESNTTGWSGNGTYVRTNLVPNPSFETNVTGWTAGTNTTLNQSATGAGQSGDFCARLFSSIGTASLISMTSDFVTVSAGGDYTLSAYTQSNSGNSNLNVTVIVNLYWYTSGSVLISKSTISTGNDSPGSWARRSGTATAPATAAKCKIELAVSANGLGSTIPVLDRHFFDSILLEADDDLNAYFDGASANVGGLTHAWTGTAHASASTSTSVSQVSQDTAHVKYGTKALKVVNAFAAGPAVSEYTVTGLTDAAEYKVIAWAYVPTQDRTVSLKVGGITKDTTTTDDAYEKLEGTFTASGTTAVLQLAHSGSGDAANFWVDGVLVTQSPYFGESFDGDTADGSVTYAWTGTAHASTSTADDSDTTVLTSSTARAQYGTRSLLVADEHSRPTPLTVTYTISGLTNGVSYVASARVYLPAQARTVSLSVDSGSALATSTVYDGWETLSTTFTATSSTHVLKVAHSGSGDADDFYLDAVLWTEVPFFSGYFDGAQPGASWVGVPHASKSTYVGAGSSASTVLWLNTDADWDKVWWAKGRLFAVDVEGYWYALSPVGGLIAQADAFWNSGKTGVNWSLTEGTGPVYISDGFDIYTVTVDTDGVVPTLTTPTTAARVPLGEQISAVSYYLGYLIVCSSRGVRAAATQDTDVLLGPLVLKGDFSTVNRVGAFDTKAYAVGRLEGRGGDAVLCAVDLGQFVADLLPAWSPLATVSELASDASGAVVDSGGRIYTWAAETLLVTSTDDRAASGYLTTGFHRFGTLEPKQFQTVLVRVGGSGGTVAVARVDADGTETALATITVPVSSATEVNLATAGPAEMIGLKFTLSRDASDPTVGPELLGYQLRALPAPKRQRMIRLPLALKDTESRGGAPAGGYVGSAWDRLTALETMEETGATTTFADFRTGETATVSVESVEHRGETPPGNNGTGFGGLIFVTLRKIS